MLVLVQGAGAGLWQFELWNLRVGFAPGRCGVPFMAVRVSERGCFRHAAPTHVVLCGVYV